MEPHMPLTNEQQLKCARIFASMWTEFLDGDHDETTQMYIDSSELVDEFAATEDDIVDTELEVGDTMQRLNADGEAVITFVEEARAFDMIPEEDPS